MHPSRFTQVFHRVQQAKTRYVVVYGGASSSKSYSVHQLELLNIMQCQKGDTLLIRKYSADIRESSYKLLQQLIAEWEIRGQFDYRFSGDQRCIIYKPTGRSIIFKGVDDSEKLKSIVGIKRIVIEEASQLNFDDFLEISRRARGMEDIQIILILNPISEHHWIKTKLCDEGSPYHNETTLIKVTYKDNCNSEGKSFLTQADITELERLQLVDENQYRIYALGEWGVENKEGKFCWAFTREQIKATARTPQHGLWATFDFNVNPMTCTVAQIFINDHTIRAIECIQLHNSDIWKMCAQLKARYPDALWLVTGDATGRNTSALVQDHVNFYTIIEQQLNLGGGQLKVPSINPPVEENKVLVNAVHRNWTVEIDPDRCQPLIYDLTYVEVDGRGDIIKDRTSPKKFADFLDNWRYLLNTAIRPFMGWD